MGLRDEGRGFGTASSNLKRLALAVTENVDALPDISAEKAELDAAIADSDEAIRRRDVHLAQTRQASKDVKATLARGLEAALRLQNAVRFKLGRQDEKLREFLLKPLGKRTSPTLTRAQAAEKEAAALKEQLAQLTGGSGDESKGVKPA
jgi:hypothetical protein